MNETNRKPFQLWLEHPWEGFSEPVGYDTLRLAVEAAQADDYATRTIITGAVIAFGAESPVAAMDERNEEDQRAQAEFNQRSWPENRR